MASKSDYTPLPGGEFLVNNNNGDVISYAQWHFLDEPGWTQYSAEAQAIKDSMQTSEQAKSFLNQFVQREQVPTGQVSGDVPVTSLQETLVKPQGGSWRDAFNKVLEEYKNAPNQAVPTVAYLAKTGYFNQFPDFDAAASEQLGQWLASGQASVDQDVLGDLSQEDLWLGSVVGAPLIGALAGPSSAGVAATETGAGMIGGAAAPGALAAGGATSLAGLLSQTAGPELSSITEPELAALIESGTVGTEGAALESMANLGLPAAGVAPAAVLPAGMAAGADTLAGVGTQSATAAETAAAAGGATAAGNAIAPSSSGGNAPAAVAGGTALSRLLGLDPDLASLLGIGAATGLGMYGANRQADALRDIANQSRADRAPFLSKSLEYLNSPDAYLSGPGKSSMDAVLRGLSVKGNPAGMPSSLALAGDYGLRSWLNATTGLANLGLAGEDVRANAMTNAAGADANVLNSLGWGLGQVTNPPTSLEQLLKQMRGSGVSLT